MERCGDPSFLPPSRMLPAMFDAHPQTPEATEHIPCWSGGSSEVKCQDRKQGAGVSQAICVREASIRLHEQMCLDSTHGLCGVGLPSKQNGYKKLCLRCIPLDPILWDLRPRVLPKYGYDCWQVFADTVSANETQREYVQS